MFAQIFAKKFGNANFCANIFANICANFWKKNICANIWGKICKKISANFLWILPLDLMSNVDYWEETSMKLVHRSDFIEDGWVVNVTKASAMPPQNSQKHPKWAFWGVPKMALGVPESKF